MTAWRTLAVLDEPTAPDDWRERLAARLGQRPRRIGAWAELALYGALACLDAAGEDGLPADASLWVTSQHGPVSATGAALAQSAERGLPLPFAFLQTQPSQLLAALCPPLRWNGDARFVIGRDIPGLLRLAQLEAGPSGLLFGWVEEGPTPRSQWWRWVGRP